jgi:hypothetical protein
MKKVSFIRVAAFMTAFTFISAQSAYGPSVYAGMQPMNDEQLAGVNAAELSLDLNMTVRAVAAGSGGNPGLILDDRKAVAANRDSINIGSMEIGGSAGFGSAGVNTTMRLGVGTLGARTWLVAAGIVMPQAGTSLGFNATNIYLTDGDRPDASKTRFLGNVTLYSLEIGQNVNPTALPNLRPSFSESAFSSNTPWLRISSHGGSDQGLELFGEIAAYAHSLRLQYRGTTDATNVRADGIYIYGLMGQVIAAPRSAPTAGSLNSDRTGSLRIGGNFPIYGNPNADPPVQSGWTAVLVPTIDVGSANGTTVMRINQPIAGSIRVRNFGFNSNNWGAFALDDAIFYKNQITIRNL